MVISIGIILRFFTSVRERGSIIQLYIFNGNANFDINNATFANAEKNGVSLRNSPGGSIQNSTFRDIGGYGVYSRANSGGPLITVTNNTFENTGRNGLYRHRVG
jgi:hypothetical protein